MTHAKLIKELCRREAGKTQVSVAQIMEIIGHLADIFHEELNANDGFSVDGLTQLLDSLGEKRAKKKARSELK